MKQERGYHCWTHDVDLMGTTALETHVDGAPGTHHVTHDFFVIRD